MSETKVSANLFQSMALGGTAASFAVNFTHPIVRAHKTACVSMRIYIYFF
jgi:hypothetical protein